MVRKPLPDPIPLKIQSPISKANAKLNSGEARKRADALQARLHKRLEELKLEAHISPLPPVVLGGLLVVPVGLRPPSVGTASTTTDRSTHNNIPD